MDILDCKLRTVINTVASLSNNVTQVSRGANLTYSYTTDIINKLEEKGFIITEKVGRDRTIKLTEKGLLLKHFLEKIGEMLYER